MDSKKKQKQARRAWYLRRTSGKALKAPDGPVSELKREAIVAYGGKCAQCGETSFSQLQLDHTENNGHKHRLLVSKGRAGLAFYRALKKQGFRKDEEYPLEVICYDCHVTTTQERRFVDSE